MKVSIAIPAYSDSPLGLSYLKESFNSILEQTFTDFEVIVSDHSTHNDLSDLCEQYSDKFKIVYIKNYYGRGIPTINANNSMKYCSGEYIKILHHDDFFVDNMALEKIVKALDSSGKKWLASGFNHTIDGKNFFNSKKPKYPNHLLIGNNLLGAPTNITVRNDSKLDFDTNITMGIDIEWYHRLRMNYGLPYMLNDVLVTSRIRDDRVSAKASSNYDIVIEGDNSSWQFIQSELEYIQQKHQEFFDNWEYPDEN